MSKLAITQINSANVQQSEQTQKPTKPETKSVSFWDEAWTGHQIAKLTGDNFVTDWLQNKINNSRN